jgi:hypothetical protein
MFRLLILAAVVSLGFSTAIAADPVAWDAATFDQFQVGMLSERALVVLDNRAGEEATYFNEVSFPGVAWGDIDIYGQVGYSPWQDLISYPPEPVVIGNIEWTQGTIYYTPGSRQWPTLQPIAQWRLLDADPEDMFTDGVMIGYVIPGGWWTTCPQADLGSGFFHSPAVVEVNGVQYSDSDPMPNWQGLEPVPEPATLGILAAGGMMLLRRRR